MKRFRAAGEQYTVTAESLRVTVDPYVSVLEAREVDRCNNIFYVGRIENQNSVPVESSVMVQGYTPHSPLGRFDQSSSLASQ